MTQKILIIIPAYQEEANIAATIREVRKKYHRADVLVVDDGSLDQTRREAEKEKALVVSLPFNLGIGAAVQTGFQYAKNYEYDVAVQVDGDLQHDPAFLDVLVQPVLDGHFDMTIGSRFIPPYLGYQSSFIRRIGIHFFAHLISFLTQYKVTDPTSGFRAFNKKMIGIFADNYPQDFPEPEAIVVAGAYNARVQEIPVIMRKRTGGSSSIRYLKTFYYMLKVTLAILLDKIKRYET